MFRKFRKEVDNLKIRIFFWTKIVKIISQFLFYKNFIKLIK